MKITTTLSLALGAALCLASTASAQTTLFQDGFDPGNTAALNGRTPTTTTGGATWKATTGAEIFLRDGTADGGLTGAYLDFAPQEGFIYTLSADITATAIASNNWLAFGWVDNTNPANPATHNNDSRGYAWGLIRNNGEATTLRSIPGDFVAQGDTGNSASFEIILDTRNAADVKASITVTGSSGNLSFTNESLGTLAGIGLQGFGFSSNNSPGTVDNLLLTAIPEPSAFALFAGLGVLFLVARRRVRD